ncbi:hypothetical protein Lnau_2136 [Legionella nautarum]|uniref:Uncharacterized protein n=2 Tax=Legionella nautarum TaxID=45070 RepID=A0A0W0WNE3_9GAMM|nr:hypothetical protein Lnau_2136 [Legionella nautarum]
MENEVILLRNIYDHIDEMVNFSLFKIQGIYTECNILFHDSNQMKLFFILLVDFLSMTDKKGPIKTTTFLNGLADISITPQFSVDDSEKELKIIVIEFQEWLKKEKIIDVWMPSIDRSESLSISRFDMIKLSGSISKHNNLRADGLVKGLQKILQNSGFEINETKGLLLLPDFYERFHNDILIFLSSHICEFLNNIRLAIYSYLLPQFDRSYYKCEDGLAYRYRIPDYIRSDYARVCYWELMNKVRSKPYMKKFVISSNLKGDLY